VFLRSCPKAVTLLLLLVADPASGQQVCSRDCGTDLKCIVELSGCLLNQDKAREAIALLKPLVKERSAEAVLARCLARAYLADKNPFWAQKTLQEAVSRNPKDCQSLSWLAWVYIGQGYVDLAREILKRPECPITEAERTRWLLLRAFVARTKEDHQATSDLVGQVADRDSMYAEDEELWHYLRRHVDPSWIEPIRLRLDLSGGYTSNATAGLPTDPGLQGPKSPVGRLELIGTLVWPSKSTVRPALDLNFRGHGLTAKDASDQSYLELAARPAVILGRDMPRVVVGYEADLLLVNQDKRSLFYSGHRGEVELEMEKWTAFLGAGYRIFDEDARTRAEFDGGVGGGFLLFDRLQVMLVGLLRYHLASEDPYDLMGATGILVMRTSLGAGFNLRVMGSFGIDYFLNSGGDAGDLYFGTTDKRFEMFSRLSAGVWSPAWSGVRLGLIYDLSWRDSTADTDRMDFDFLEHRAFLTVRWTFDSNPWAPALEAPRVHTPLHYGLSSRKASGLDEERIQDLLRQDEADRRGACGCGS
jgi:hypothetical protein